MEIKTHEVWRVIYGTGGRYEASNLGRVRSLHLAGGRPLRNANEADGNLLASWIGDRDFPMVTIGTEAWSVAACVLSAFVGPRPSPEYRASYRDGNRQNLKLENLSWMTAVEHRKITRDLGRSAVRPTKIMAGKRAYQCRGNCKRWLPAARYYKLKKRVSPHGVVMSHCGLQSECKDCANERRVNRRREYADESPTLLQRILPIMKTLDGVEIASDEPNGHIGTRLREARSRADLTVAELARLAKINAATISTWERGCHIPREKPLLRVISVLNRAADPIR